MVCCLTPNGGVEVPAPLGAEIPPPEPVGDTPISTDEYPQPEAQRAGGREDRFSRLQDLMRQKHERQRRVQVAWRAASLPTELEVPALLGTKFSSAGASRQYTGKH
jgi:hypothetical protein